MRTLDEIDILDGVKQILRDLTIQRIDKKIFTFDSTDNKDYRRWNFWNYRKRKQYINTIFELGGVLTGSKVLSKSYIDGKRILERRETIKSDWDFLVTEESVYKMTSDIPFKQFNGILSHRLIENDSYGSGGQTIDLIIVKELPLCHSVNEFSYADPLSIINSKVNLVNQKIKGYEKHEKDLQEFYWKFNYLVK